MQIKRFLVLAMLLFMAACAGQREPAQAAIQNIRMTLNAAKADGDRYASTELAAVEAKVAELQTSFDKKDYDAVVSTAPVVLKQAQDLHGVIFSKKNEAKAAMLAEWPLLAATVTQWLPAVQDQLEKLQKRKKTPEGVDVAAAQAALNGLDMQWGKVQQDLNAGRVESALASGKEVKAKIETAAAAMKFTLPEPKAPSGPGVGPPPPLPPPGGAQPPA